MAVVEDTEVQRGRHRALAEPSMDGRGRHRRAAAPGTGARRWRTPLLAVGAAVVVFLGLYLVVSGPAPGVVQAGGQGGQDAVDRGDSITVPPTDITVPLNTGGPVAADDQYNAKDAAEATTEGEAPGRRAASVSAEAAPEEEEPEGSAAASSPSAAAPVAPAEPPRAELVPAAPAPVVVAAPTGGRCATVLGDANVVPHVAQAGHHLAQRFEFPLSEILGRGPRTTAGSDHPSGRALDFMVYGNATLGTLIKDYVLEHRVELGVTYVIWQQRISNGTTSRRMADRGGRTANHYDHVHISFGVQPGPGLPC